MRALSRLAGVVAVIIAVIATIWLVRAFESRNLPELRLWHQASLDNEFSVDDYPDGLSLKAYLELEERLMQELETKVVAQVPPANRKFLSRYTETSPINPENLPVTGTGPFNSQWTSHAAVFYFCMVRRIRRTAWVP